MHWASADAWEAAPGDGFRALVGRPGWEEFPPLPTRYEVVHAGSAAGHTG